MRKLRTALCLILLALVGLLLPSARRALPQDNRALVARKYDGWSGVLRLWVCEGWQPGAGSFAGWLNRCASVFEKRHPGVYVQPQIVDAGAIASMNDSGILPPDMLLFPPGVLEAPRGLMPLDIDAGPRPSLAGVGAAGGRTFAVPVAMGGYAWVYNAGLIDDIPPDWRDAGPAVPPDDAGHSYGAALLSLCAESHADGAADHPDVEAPGLDLGLPAAANASSRALPEDFDFSGTASRDFINGKAPALLATPRELRRLQALSDQGRGPDWRLGETAAFTDQLLCMAVTDRPGAEARQALCLRFLETLLDDDCQGMLASVGAFAVTDAPSGYAVGDPLGDMDAAMRGDGLRAPRCFGAAWKNSAEAIVREFIAGEADADALWAALNAELYQNPNIS